jgi:hypothetical protein
VTPILTMNTSVSMLMVLQNMKQQHQDHTPKMIHKNMLIVMEHANSHGTVI